MGNGLEKIMRRVEMNSAVGSYSESLCNVQVEVGREEEDTTITEEINELDNALKILTSAVSDLAMKLSPISAPFNFPPRLDDAPARSTEVTCRIAAAKEMVSDFASRIFDLTQKVRI